MISEYDQIRKGLEKIRSLKEEITRDSEVIELNQVNNDPEVTPDGKVGEKIAFDDINTVGFLNSQKSLSDGAKNEITNTVGIFIKSTGLLLDTITINVFDFCSIVFGSIFILVVIVLCLFVCFSLPLW